MNKENDLVASALAIVREEILHRITEETLIRDEPRTHIQELLVYLRRKVRFWAMASETQWQDLWDYIRDDEDLLDFVLNTTSTLRMRLETRPGLRDGSGGDWGALISSIVLAYGEWTGSGDRPARSVMTHVVIDQETQLRLATTQKLRDYLTHNPWTLTLVVMSMLPLTGLVTTSTRS